MLILNRRVGEKIMIDKGQIIIKVLNISKDKVTLSFIAPAHVDVGLLYLKSMLILTRRFGEKILINKGQITILLLENHGQFALGIIAPTHIDVDREEIFIAKQKDAVIGAQNLNLMVG